MECKSCGAVTLLRYSIQSDFLINGVLDHEHQVRFCERCRLGITFPKLDQSELNEFYSDEYGKTLQRRNFLSFLQNIKFRRDLKTIKLFQNKSDFSVLDLGAGQGDFVGFLKRVGIRAIGVEISKSERKIAKQIHGVELQPGQAENFSINDRVDVVVMRHVLEHVTNPESVLINLRDNILNPEGTLVILVPNFDSSELRLFGKFWHGLDVPRHRFHFTDLALEQMLEKNNYDLVFKKYESNGLDFVRSFQNMLRNVSNSKIYKNVLEQKLLWIIIFSPFILITGIIKPPRIFLIARVKNSC